MTQTLIAPAPTLAGMPLYRVTVSQYEAMLQSGIIDEDEKCELIEGVLIQKLTNNPPHTVASMLLIQTLGASLPDGYCLAVEIPVLASELSLPEPDAAVLVGQPREYSRRRPAPADVPLIVEVCDTTLAFDRGTKRRVYAHAGFACYWIVNLVENQVEVYRDPTGPDEEPVYRESLIYRPGDTVPLLLDGQKIAEIPVAALLP